MCAETFFNIIWGETTKKHMPCRKLQTNIHTFNRMKWYTRMAAFIHSTIMFFFQNRVQATVVFQNSSDGGFDCLLSATRKVYVACGRSTHKHSGWTQPLHLNVTTTRPISQPCVMIARHRFKRTTIESSTLACKTK